MSQFTGKLTQDEIDYLEDLLNSGDRARNSGNA